MTGILHETVGSELADMVFHDLAGWLMMPLALALLWVELQILYHLWLEPAVGSPVRPSISSPPPPAPTRAARPWKCAGSEPSRAAPPDLWRRRFMRVCAEREPACSSMNSQENNRHDLTQPGDARAASLRTGACHPAGVRARPPERTRSAARARDLASCRPGFAAALASGLDVMVLLKALRRRWLVAFTLGLLCAVGALAGVYFLMPPRNTAFAQIYISSINPVILPKGGYEGGKGEFVVYQNTQIFTHIKSRFVLNAALKRDKVLTLEIVQKQTDPVIWLEEELKVEFKEGSEVMTISMIGSDAPALVAIVKAVTEETLREVRKRSRTARASCWPNWKTSPRRPTSWPRKKTNFTAARGTGQQRGPSRHAETGGYSTRARPMDRSRQDSRRVDGLRGKAQAA